ncbi:carbohydrate ABC transporter permease [Microbacterium sp. VKM Ac-2923]|uniref:carbohydrate ABC transporter permease n=1 Tax=Microbacterium sp. VKM Ac-2923 TaxID=2929476 RepID=UPI001FB2F042|nr:carbohydrate ABC transporter permease [Microbacterium sp. VKM Ac-2923]MCJ1708823.1 carbohydrate ABC transporter permease [Microbacterium sp. VKM Ac-2923]
MALNLTPVRPDAPAPTPRRRFTPVRTGSARTAGRVSRTIINVIMIALCAAIIVPTAWIFMASIKTRPEFYGDPWALPLGVHVQNFVDAFVNARMGDYFVNSIFVTVLALAISLVVAVPAAYVLARFEFRGKSVLEVAILAGLFINVNYIVVPIFLQLLGWDRALRGLFPGGVFIDNLAVLALVYAATSLPFTIYLLSTFFRTIPVEYEEAAMLDGSSRFRTMVSVMLPLALPAISTALLFNFLAYWNDFIISLTLVPGDSKTLQVGLLNLFQAQRAAADYGVLYAGMVIVMVPVIVFYAIIQRRLLQSVGGGGIK